MKGYKASCMRRRHISLQLKHSRKTVYLGSRRFLPMFHRYRRRRKAFNGSIEKGRAPKALTDEEVYQRGISTGESS